MLEFGFFALPARPSRAISLEGLETRAYSGKNAVIIIHFLNLYSTLMATAAIITRGRVASPAVK